MTVKELKKIIEHIPDDHIVFISVEMPKNENKCEGDTVDFCISFKDSVKEKPS